MRKGKKKKKEVKEEKRCTCGEEVVEPHICPFSQDVHDDSETLCECCDYCEQQCAWDI